MGIFSDGIVDSIQTALDNSVAAGVVVILAAAHTAGVVTLILEKFNTSSGSPDQVREALMCNSVYGKLNLESYLGTPNALLQVPPGNDLFFDLPSILVPASTSESATARSTLATTITSTSTGDFYCLSYTASNTNYATQNTQSCVISGCPPR
jgi:hypothetical protein